MDVSKSNLNTLNERRYLMPTINQLVRKSRENKIKKSKSPHLSIGFNSLQKVYTNVESP